MFGALSFFLLSLVNAGLAVSTAYQAVAVF